MEWKNVTIDANVIEDKQYGISLIDKSYMDKKTHNVLLLLDAQYAASLDVKAAKTAHELKDIIRDRSSLLLLKQYLSTGDSVALQELGFQEEPESFKTVKTTVNLQSLKDYMNNVTPHAMSEKISKTVSARINQFARLDPMQIVYIFGGILGAIAVAYLIIG